jgi:prephenate dehydrogenase
MVSNMEDGFRLQNSRVAIAGLGLMGGSLAMALKGKCAALSGIDSDHATLELALDKQIVDQADSDPVKLLSQVDLVILATPIPAIIDFIRKLPLLIETPCIVLDLGSTKRDIVQVMSTLPELFDPVGGHPICGKEKLGLEHADRNLYLGAPFVITPMERTSQRAKSAVAQIISVIGAHAIEMSATDHDRILATTSHLPFLISSALARATPQEFASLAGPGFRSTSRLAGTPAHMMMGILKSNRENILKAIMDFYRSLNEIEAVLQNENYSELELILKRSRTSYLTITEN